jgi:hypothetical protein
VEAKVEQTAAEPVLERVAPEEPAGPPEPETPTEGAAPPEVEPSEAEKRAKRLLIIILVVVGLLTAAMLALLVFLSIDAYQAALVPAGAPSPSSVVVAVLRDAAIIFVAFETLIIGALLVILMVQVQSLLVLLRDEIRPMLESVNETLATVRGTTQFVSHNVVSPVMRWAGYLAGFRRMVQGVSGLSKSEPAQTQEGEGGYNGE